MASRLLIYNNALLRLGERRLASLTEAREPRRVLDDLWDGGFVRSVLEEGNWIFARRTAMMDSDPGITPEFGPRSAFAKPADWVRTVQISADENLSSPLTLYRDEGWYLYADVDPLYVCYVSSDAGYGGDLSAWPDSFRLWVECELARRAAQRITGSGTMTDELRRESARLLIAARGKNGIAQPPVSIPLGSWSGARGGTGAGRRSRDLSGLA